MATADTCLEDSFQEHKGEKCPSPSVIIWIKSLCVWGVGGGMYWGGNNDLKRWPLVLRIHHNEHSVPLGNLHFLKRHLDRVTYLGVNLRTLERAAHFPTDAAVLKNQPVAQGEMRKHNWWFQARHPIFIFVIPQFSVQVYTDFFLSLK